METIWKQYLDTQYEVSTMGEVRSNFTNKVLKCGTDTDGYLQFICCKDGKKITKRVHQAVAITFLDNPENKPTIDHVNRDKKDNRLENLRWATRSEQNRNKNGYGNIPFKGVIMRGKKFVAQIRINGKTKHIGTFDTPEEASDAYNNFNKQV